MNVLITGEGEEVIVMLPGAGTPTPALDYTLLINELSPDYKLVVVEPFGYGLSDVINKPRTIENITDEVHECLETLGFDEYIMMGHSISGVYGLEYMEKYGDEVTAFVGLDSSVPNQYADFNEDDFPNIKPIQWAVDMGFLRVVGKIKPEAVYRKNDDPKLEEQLKLLTLKNTLNKNTVDESSRIQENFNKTLDIPFPKDTPGIFFVASESEENMKGWIDLHTELVKDVKHAEVHVYDAAHYIHHTEYENIAKELKLFLNDAQS